MAEANAPSSESLDRSLASGVGWTAVYRWLGQAISWVITAWIAHVLTPGDFGLVAMAALVIGLGKMVEDLGLDAVIVQDRELSRTQIARLGGLAVLVGIGFTLVYSALAWPLSLYFEEPAVRWLIMAMSLVFITDSLQIVPRALMQRRLQFRRLAFVAFLTFVVQSGSGAILVLLGFSYWALALNALCAGVVIALVVNFMAPHPLEWPRQLRELARPIGFAWRMIVSRISWYLYANADQWIIGRVLGKASLGAYGFSLQFASMPVSEVTSLIGKVVPGVFSEVQKDTAALRRYYLVLTETIGMLTLPMCAGLALTADHLVSVGLGPQWGEAVAPLRILCAYLAVTSVSVLISHALIWTGRAHMNMLLNLLSLVVLPVSLYVGVHWGLAGLAWALVIAFPITNIPGYFVVFRFLDLRLSTFFGTLMPALQGCAVMAVAVLLVRHSLPAGLHDAWRLGAQVIVGVVVYFGFLFTLHRERLIAMYLIARGRSGAVLTSMPLAAEPPQA